MEIAGSVIAVFAGHQAAETAVKELDSVYNTETIIMKRIRTVALFSVLMCLGFSTSLLAAQLPPSGAETPRSDEGGAAGKSAEKCVGDLHAFEGQMEKDGYWAVAYPVGGFEVRGLFVSVNLLAQHGEQQLCEDSLSMARDIYSRYLADMHGRAGAAG
jgi:hypothetical protein